MYESLLDKKRLNIIRRSYGEAFAEELISSINKCLNSESLKNNAVIKLFSLMDEPQDASSANNKLYSIGDRKLTVVNNNKHTEEAVKRIPRNSIVGFDTEQRPKFVNDGTSNDIAIVQIATKSECYLFQMKYITHPPPIYRLIEAEDVVMVGFGLSNDIKELCAQFSITPKSIIDFQEILKKLGSSKEIGAKKAVQIFLRQNLRKQKRAALSNWEHKNLKGNQLSYASEDATAPLDVFERFLTDYPQLGFTLPAWFRRRFGTE